MCDFDPKNEGRRMDPCMVGLVKYLKAQGLTTVACCCGHGTYPMTVVVKGVRGHYELLSGVTLPRSKRFYLKDGSGRYFIPEVVR